MDAVQDPYFWAFVAMLGLVGGNAIQGSPVVGRRTWFGVVVISMVTFGRVALVLPFVQQIRFSFPLSDTLGVLIIGASLLLMAPLLRIRPATRPDTVEPLSTRGVFGLVRHPGYLANIIWGIGWAILYGSAIGLALTPVWIIAFYLHALIEEEALLKEYGSSYREYMGRVRARLVPGLPV
ncbi:MAG: isoprenylcysteine carboxylmethyltransferase family protein [Deltaproteobacteria bacterium]|nr:isoprenylcysteine carboxylmethyltransferase family protein [Deltaproteobacteria bacterium]